MTHIFFRIVDAEGETLTDCGTLKLFDIIESDEPDVWGLLDFRTARKAMVTRDGRAHHIEISVLAAGDAMRIELDDGMRGRELEAGGFIDLGSIKVAVLGDQAVQVPG